MRWTLYEGFKKTMSFCRSLSVRRRIVHPWQMRRKKLPRIECGATWSFGNVVGVGINLVQLDGSVSYWTVLYWLRDASVYWSVSKRSDDYH